MYTKSLSFTKTLVAKVITALAGLVVVMTFLEFIFKWKIFSYVYNIGKLIFSPIYRFPFEALVFLCLVLLVYLHLNLRRQFVSSKTNILEKQIVDNHNSLEVQIKKKVDEVAASIKAVEVRLEGKIQASEKTLDDRLFEAERTLVDF